MILDGDAVRSQINWNSGVCLVFLVVLFALLCDSLGFILDFWLSFRLPVSCWVVLFLILRISGKPQRASSSNNGWQITGYFSFPLRRPSHRLHSQCGCSVWATGFYHFSSNVSARIVVFKMGECGTMEFQCFWPDWEKKQHLHSNRFLSRLFDSDSLCYLHCHCPLFHWHWSFLRDGLSGSYFGQFDTPGCFPCSSWMVLLRVLVFWSAISVKSLLSITGLVSSD